MTGPELIALGHAAIARAHELILLGGALGLLSIIAGMISRRDRLPLIPALLAGSAAAPTDAAAVAVLLRRAGAALPERLHALLEVESGLNDPMSVFLTILLLRLIAEPGSVGIGEAALMFL